MTKNLIRIFLGLILALTPYFVYAEESSNIQKTAISNSSRLYIDKAFYLLDKKLVSVGYSLKNERGNLILLHNNKPISQQVFLKYSPSVSQNRLKKLYIEYNDSLTNSIIHLTHTKRSSKTDETGKGVIDLYTEGQKIYTLSLSNSEDKRSLNFIFSLDFDMNITCSGIKKFNCEIKEYK